MFYIVTVLGVPVAGPYEAESAAMDHLWRLRRETSGSDGVDLRRFRVVSLSHGPGVRVGKILHDPGFRAVEARVYTKGETPDHRAFLAQAEGLCVVVRHEDGTLEVCA